MADAEEDAARIVAGDEDRGLRIIGGSPDPVTFRALVLFFRVPENLGRRKRGSSTNGDGWPVAAPGRPVAIKVPANLRAFFHFFAQHADRFFLRAGQLADNLDD